MEKRVREIELIESVKRRLKAEKKLEEARSATTTVRTSRNESFIRSVIIRDGACFASSSSLYLHSPFLALERGAGGGG